MNKIMSRFGEIEYDPQNTITFTEGLLGFESLREFVVIPIHDNEDFFWVQSIEDPEVAFILTDPTKFFPDYIIVPSDEENKRLGLGTTEKCSVLAIATVRENNEITLNLVAPIMFSIESNKAIQVVVEELSQKRPELLKATLVRSEK